MPDSNDDDAAARTTTPTTNDNAPTNNVATVTPSDNGANDHENEIIDDVASFDPNAGRHLLSSSYRSFSSPCDMGDRYVAFLLRNERTLATLQSHVMMDHLAIVREYGGGSSISMTMMNPDGGNNASNIQSQNADGEGEGDHQDTAKKSQQRANASIEIDAFQLISLDPVIGNMTLRYPDTLLGILEDSTTEARMVLRRRMEVAMEQALAKMKRSKPDMSIPNKVYNRETNNMQQLLNALKDSGKNGGYRPPPLHARLVHLPPHSQFCKSTLSTISAKDVGTVVQICGTCVRTGPVRMMETKRVYKCLGKGCGHICFTSADFGTANNALPGPVICSRGEDEFGEKCYSTNFAVVEGASEHADYQEMKVQESASALNRVGSVPRSILIKLSHDLVDKCNPGDEVVVVGNLHAEWQSNSLGANVEVMVGMSMRAHSVRVINVDDEFTGGTSSVADVHLMARGGGMKNAAAAMAASSGNLREKFRREFDVFWSDAARQRPIATRDYIVRAICPKLYGMHAVKLGLLLVLIGGASVSMNGEVSMEEDESYDEQKGERVKIHPESDEEAPVAFKIGGDDNDDEDDQYNQPRKRASNGKQKSNNKSNAKAFKSKRRIQSHILLIGDPGTGKSQFLRFAAALSPRSVLTTGTGSSRAGLTCAAVRDGSGSGGNEFSLEAGALALADRGVCCIDEFGCMSKEDRTSIHEAMEQQTISVAKAGIIAKLNARTTIVAVMNPVGGIYDNNDNLERNSRLGSPLLSRFDLIFIMMDQADGYRDDKIAHFLLQQSIIPGSGYDRPLEMMGSHQQSNNEDDTSNGHWGMEKLRAYIATIREKFQPSLTPEASELLQKHYYRCRQQKDGQLVTVRFLESLIRLSQAHARLMYRDEVLEEDAAAVIILMECTAAASGRDDNDVDLYQNPINTEFPSFDISDDMFGEDKRNLLCRYSDNIRMTQQYDNNGHSPPPFRPKDDRRERAWNDFEKGKTGGRSNFARINDGHERNDPSNLRDQWNRPMSQSSPHPSSTKKIRQAMDAMGPSQHTPASSHGSVDSGQRDQYSENRANVSQQPQPQPFHCQSDNTHQSDGMNSNTGRGGNNGFDSKGRYDNTIQRHDARNMSKQHQYRGQMSQQKQQQHQAQMSQQQHQQQQQHQAQISQQHQQHQAPMSQQQQQQQQHQAQMSQQQQQQKPYQSQMLQQQQYQPRMLQQQQQQQQYQSQMSQQQHHPHPHQQQQYNIHIMSQHQQQRGFPPQHGYGNSNPNASSHGPPQEQQERPQSGGFLRVEDGTGGQHNNINGQGGTQTQPWEAGRNDHTVRLSQQVNNFQNFRAGGPEGGSTDRGRMSQGGSSGKKRKKRRSSD